MIVDTPSRGGIRVVKLCLLDGSRLDCSAMSQRGAPAKEIEFGWKDVSNVQRVKDAFADFK
jgi:hypothetical protein